MTVIAWDGKVLAADKQCTTVGYAHTVTKIFRVPNGRVGFSGNGGHSSSMLQWFHDGCIKSEFPKAPGEDYASALFISDCGEVRGYAGNVDGSYIIYEDKFLAFGAGRDYALAAMFLGKSAIEAVQVAIQLDTSCGMGIDVLYSEGV